MPARHDLTTDPALAAQLLQARRGTAFFNRKLNELTDAELHGASLLPGWSRAHVVAHVGYNARAITRLVEWARTGEEIPMYASVEQRNYEIAYGATLSATALRNLNEHAAITLNVEWRDLPAESWQNPVKTIQGRVVPASETVWMRTREVWVHAVDLDNGASFRDIPAGVLERLLGDITGAWHKNGSDKGLVLKVSGARELDTVGDTEAADPEIVSGELADITQWACGRVSPTAATPSSRIVPVSSNRREHPVAPRWI